MWPAIVSLSETRRSAVRSAVGRLAILSPCTQTSLRTFNRPRGLFLESPGNFTGPKSNIQIEMLRIKAQFLASKLLHFVSLTDSFIMLDAKLLKPRSSM